MTTLVSTEWLAAHAGTPGLRLLDASYHVGLPGEAPRDAAAEFAAGHLPGATFMDLFGFNAPDAPLPSTMPDAAHFAARAGRLGLRRDDRIVLYDDAPHRTAARAWVMLRAFGFTDVALLDGGLAKWKAEGRPLEQGAAPVAPTIVEVPASGIGLLDLAAMRALQQDGSAQIVDARSTARFTGAEPDPRPGVAPGHIPGARNLPYPQLFNADGTWKQGEALAAAFTTAGVDLDRPLAMTCGSGITASVLAFGAHVLGREAAVYDGSWTEWGGDPATPKVTGDA
ncbi:thiosulfate/3-mercaptopyruvate sulfurtransferase [Sphingomonas endophytica]|uniref:Sulfurtransferase n=1 Tax=Sphingomonas endophytica TaxID=869719 RepID=A0A7X0JE67_9SPHN|nr:sulfurtransferase [Sphingomonas endophytica]MBB6505132.1 thiosulfate/3-mercaptopyruvate sulfurtransferase [Sphingomonas endophytica]